MRQGQSGRSVLVVLGIAIVGYVLVAVFGNVTDVQSASSSKAFGDAAADAGNRVRLALLFDMFVFLPGYLLTVRWWSKWRIQAPHIGGATGTLTNPPRLATVASWCYRIAPLAIVGAAVADFAENCCVYIGLGIVDLSDVATAMMVAPAETLITLLQIAAAVKWIGVALALLALVGAGISELLIRNNLS